ncbi:ribosomal maturation YjgA family protein [Pradoshia sp.]
MNKRLSYLLGILISILFGLLSRKLGSSLPVFLAEHAGDALWAMMIYFGFRFLLPNKSMGLSISLSVCFCFAIEFSQAYQAGWINAIRNTTIGALVLGKGFLWIDLVRYTVGILIASVIDSAINSKRNEEYNGI